MIEQEQDGQRAGVEDKYHTQPTPADMMDHRIQRPAQATRKKTKVLGEPDEEASGNMGCLVWTSAVVLVPVTFFAIVVEPSSLAVLCGALVWMAAVLAHLLLDIWKQLIYLSQIGYVQARADSKKKR